MKNFNILVAVATLATSATVHMANAAEPQSISVRYTASDTDSARASRALYARLSHAAAKACDNLALDSRQLWRNEPYQTCVRDALSGAIGQVNRPLLTAYAAEHGVSAVNAMSIIAANH